MKRVFTVPEVKRLIKESIVKRLPPCEKSDINQQILHDHELGFEAVLTGDGDEKILLPEEGWTVFLYRGQNEEYIPCYPSLYRTVPRELSTAEVFVWRMRLILFQDMLDSYPIVNKFFKRHNFKVDYEGLAQHYGLCTSVLDLTSNLDIALFFATCWYDKTNDCYRPFDDGIDHEGIIYVFCPILANEPTPLRFEDFMKENITPIGLQPFLRPARQKGYALHIPKGKSTKSWAYRINFSNEDSRHYYEMFNGGKDLWISDILADKTKQIGNISLFSFDTFDRAYALFRPKGYSKTKLKKELISIGVILAKNGPQISFSDEECSSIIRKWNDSEGKLFCDMIGRRPWNEILDDSDNQPRSDKFTAKVSESHDYRTLKMLAEMALINMISHPEGPDGSEWINYKNTPNETHRPFTKKEQEWTRIPGKFVNLFAKRYLTEEDYLID